MKNRIMTTNIGTINLAELEFMTDRIELFIPVVAVSEKLKATLVESIQKAKEEHQKEFLDCKELKWSDAGIFVENQSLYIVSDGNKLTYELVCDFSDMENDLIETGFGIKVDLSEHEEELKQMIVKAIVNKFFYLKNMFLLSL